FLLMTAVDVELDGVDAERRHDTRLETSQVIPLNREISDTRAGNRASRSRPLLWAASFAVVAIAGILVSALLPERHATSVGEQRPFDLPDGSVVYLNTHSKIALHFSRHEREIRLLDGEALFKVARDTSRPFRVRTDDAVIQALGTEFNVRRDDH